MATAGAWLLSGLALVFVGGSEYAEIESQLWLFAVLGTLLAMLQLLVYSVLARQGQRSVYLVWAALVALVVGRARRCPRWTALLTVVVVIDLGLLAALLFVSLYLLNRPARGTPAPAPGLTP